MKDKLVQQYSDELKQIGVEHIIAEHPELKTPPEVQGYLGLTLADGLSTMIMKADNNFVAVIRRDDTRLDFEKIKKVVGSKDVRMAKPEEFIKLTGMPLGAARVYNPGLKTLLDSRLFEKDLLTGGSGSFLCSFRYKVADLKKLPDSNIVDITESFRVEKTAIIKKRFLSGITPSGDGSLHIGNYLGAVQQFIKLAKVNECYLFIADYHALTTIQDKKQLQHNVEMLILNELALLQGFLTEEEFKKIIFYRQSDISGLHTELQSILNNITPLGLLKRAHAYKDKLQKDVMEDDINVGLFSYPMLMAADILLYKPDLVPVGKDQKQHIEITRDVAGRFNSVYKKNIFKLPDAYIPEEVATVLGTDGKRKMSKSLGNIICIFDSEEVIQKQVNSTYTDPTRKHATDPGHVEGNMVFTYLDFFGEKAETDRLKEAYTKGQVSDIEVKKYLFDSLMKTFKNARERYADLKAHPEKVTKILNEGAAKARVVAGATMEEVRETIGLVNAYSISARSHLAKLGETLINIDDFACVEMRVGKVLEATNKDGSDKLIRLVVDVGEEKPRIIFTGVRSFGYTPDFFAGHQFFFITNLAPRKMLDEYSNGMIMAVDSSASSEQAGKPQFIPADGMSPGAKIR